MPRPGAGLPGLLVAALRRQSAGLPPKVATPLRLEGTSLQPLSPAGPGQALMLALNVPTCISLYGYGCRNVYELDELVAMNDPRIIFAGSVVDAGLLPGSAMPPRWSRPWACRMRVHGSGYAVVETHCYVMGVTFYGA